MSAWLRTCRENTDRENTDRENTEQFFLLAGRGDFEANEVLSGLRTRQ